MRRLIPAVVGFVVACSPMTQQVDGGGSAGGSAGGSVAGGSTAGGATAGGSAGGATAGGSAGGATAGGSAGGATAGGFAGGSTAGGFAGGSTAGGAAGGAATDGGIAADCDAWAAGASHVQHVLMNCSSPGDTAIYGFNRTKCLMQAETACTPTDRATLTRVAACDGQIAACVTMADRATAVAAINACATGTMLSSGCIGAIQ